MQSNCLKTADGVINGERQDSYGAPEDSFPIIAGYWNIFIQEKIRQATGVIITDLLDPLDVTNLMVLFKQARKLGQSPSIDNHIDSAGYEAIGADRFLAPMLDAQNDLDLKQAAGGLAEAILTQPLYGVGWIHKEPPSMFRCGACQGTGKISNIHDTATLDDRGWIICPTCKGNGFVGKTTKEDGV
jgi:hypothetical protein